MRDYFLGEHSKLMKIYQEEGYEVGILIFLITSISVVLGVDLLPAKSTVMRK